MLEKYFSTIMFPGHVPYVFSLLVSHKDVFFVRNGKRSFLISREQNLAFSVQKSDPNVAEISPTSDLKARSFFMALLDFYGCSFPLVVYTVF